MARAFNKGADALLKSGEVNAAILAYRFVVKLTPDDTNAYLALSALEHNRGNRRAARDLLEQGIQTQPFTCNTGKAPPLARILRVRGVQRGFYMLGKSRNGDYKVKLRGGNLSDRYLVSGSKYATTSFFILDENILSDGSIPSFDIIVNLISDPDIELRSLETLRTFIARHPKVPVPQFVIISSSGEHGPRVQ